MKNRLETMYEDGLISYEEFCGPAIIISCTSSCWVATHVNMPDVINLFGTDTLPTAFTAAAPAEPVLAELGERNPGVLVVRA